MTTWVLMVAPDGPAQRAQREDLEKAGFVVEVASTVEAALGSLLVISPSLILIDADLGDEARRRLADAARGTSRAAPVSLVKFTHAHARAFASPRPIPN